MVLQKLKTDAEKRCRRAHHSGRYHCSCLLQRRSASGNQGRGQDRRSRGHAYHQRAYGGGSCLRPRQEPTRMRRFWSSTLAAARFDVSVLELGDGVFEVRSTAGDNHLGGDDWDQRVIDWIADKFQAENGIDLRSRQDGSAASEGSSRKGQDGAFLHHADQHQPALHHRWMQPARSHLDYTLTRAEFERITKDLLDRCKKPVEQALTRRWPFQRATLTRSSSSAVPPVCLPFRSW